MRRQNECTYIYTYIYMNIYVCIYIKFTTLTRKTSYPEYIVTSNIYIYMNIDFTRDK